MRPDLNSAQRDAVETSRGPLLVLAGAGTGKTRVVTFRIARLIAQGTRPDRILAVTFTNKAAKEMQQRVGALLKIRKELRPHISTFHSLCVQVLRRHIHHLGYPAKFAIYSQGDQQQVARQVLQEAKIANTALRPADLLFLISQWKSRSVTPAQAGSMASTDREHLAAVAYRRYQAALQAVGGVDFDDLLLCTEKLFANHPACRREEAGRFDHILVDEYQDTNGSQYRIVRALAAGHRNLCVVGDDDQSIYGWRGAEVRHILQFRDDWPEAKIVRLEENYRSTGAILELANRLIAYNKTRYGKVLRAGRPGGERPRILQFPDETTESEQIVADIRLVLQRPGIEPRDIAILFRTNEQPRPFETELRRAKLPYLLIGGMSFFDRKEVRDLMAYLRLLDAPQDEMAFLRVCNTPARGITPAATNRLRAAAAASGVPWSEVLPKAQEVKGVSAAAAEAIRQFLALLERYRQQTTTTPWASLMTQFLEEIGYRSELVRLYPEPEQLQSRWGVVEQLVNALAEHQRNRPRGSLGDFVDAMALSERDLEEDKDQQLRRNAIAMMTLHSAKGLEFPHVYMVGMEEGLLPPRRSLNAGEQHIEEERRLCYVGLTRAQERLTLSMSLSRMKWGKPRESHPSRFLFELLGQAERAPSHTPQPSQALPTKAPQRPGGPPGPKSSAGRPTRRGR